MNTTTALEFVHPAFPERRTVSQDLSPLEKVRSYLYIPGHRLELLEQEEAKYADAIVLDLEDLVPIEHKSLARQSVVEFLKKSHAIPILVRINGIDSDYYQEDIDAVVSENLSAIRLPKAESVEAVQDIIRKIEHVREQRGFIRPIGVQLMIESAEGLKQAEKLARASHLVWSLGLGEGDLTYDLNIYNDEGLAYARSHLVYVCRAAKLPNPVQVTAGPNFTTEKLIENTQLGRRLGFGARSVLNAQHIPHVNTIYNND